MPRAFLAWNQAEQTIEHRENQVGSAAAAEKYINPSKVC
jgi:hypothetical protein